MHNRCDSLENYEECSNSEVDDIKHYRLSATLRTERKDKKSFNVDEVDAETLQELIKECKTRDATHNAEIVKRTNYV